MSSSEWLNTSIKYRLCLTRTCVKVAGRVRMFREHVQSSTTPTRASKFCQSSHATTELSTATQRSWPRKGSPGCTRVSALWCCSMRCMWHCWKWLVSALICWHQAAAPRTCLPCRSEAVSMTRRVGRHPHICTLTTIRALPTWCNQSLNHELELTAGMFICPSVLWDCNSCVTERGWTSFGALLSVTISVNITVDFIIIIIIMNVKFNIHKRSIKNRLHIVILWGYLLNEC